MFCNNCGVQINEGEKFCKKCGAPVSTQGPTMVKKTKESKSGKKWPVIILAVLAVVILITGVLFGAFYLNKPDENISVNNKYKTQTQPTETTDEKKESVENIVVDSSEVETVENVNPFEKSNEETQEEMSFDEFAATLPRCDLEGKQYFYEPEDPASEYILYETEGLRNTEGCFEWLVSDFDGDEENELLTLWLKSATDNYNYIEAQMYERTKEGILVSASTNLLSRVLGAGNDEGTIRFFIKDNYYICAESIFHSYICADGVGIDMHVSYYDGTNFVNAAQKSIGGSDFYEEGKKSVDFRNQLLALGLTKTANMILNYDQFAFIAADKGMVPWVKITAENNTYQNFNGDVEPVVTCHIIKSGALQTEYLLPNSSEVYLTLADIQGFTKEELRVARNEIYARYGWGFDDENLANYFSQKSWYFSCGYSKNVVDTDLTEVEIANRDLIIERENELP